MGSELVCTVALVAYLAKGEVVLLRREAGVGLLYPGVGTRGRLGGRLQILWVLIPGGVGRR